MSRPTLSYSSSLHFVPCSSFRPVVVPSEQAAADTVVSLCEEADHPQAAAAAVVAATAGDETTTSRWAVMEALVVQLGEVVAGLTNRQASTPKLRFADIAARCSEVLIMLVSVP